MRTREANGFGGWSTWLLGGALASALVLAACGSSSKGGFTDPDAGTADDSGGLLNNNDASVTPPGPPPACDPVTCAGAGGSCQNLVCVIRENPGGVDQGTQGKLRGGGTGDSAFKWLYPYDKTVFPRGLIAPTMQFDGTAPDAVYVHVTFSGMDYQGFFGGSNPGRVQFSPPVWTALTIGARAKDDVKVEVTKISGGAVTGPISETWTMAQGSLRGTIYYETYDSAIAGGLGSVGIMRIDPGAAKPTVIKSGCGNVCHTASADGSTLVANVGFPTGSASYDLKNSAAPVIKSQADLSFTYGGLFPDGSVLMSATHYRTWMPFGPPSSLYDAKTGAKIAAPGWDGVITNGGTTAFSPDGKHIAFNHEDNGQGHTLAAMDYDKATHTFSNLADVAKDPGGTLAWPAFTPDGKWIVYHAGSNAQFETDGGATGDLFFVELATHTAARLDAANGYTSGTTSYLPANDPALSFAPTVLPEAVGGYFWVVFTSHRSYGNTRPSKDNNGQNGKLWVAALDLSPTAGKDASHPAFFLDGQELDADNLRGFWVLSPCQADGSDCRSGDECCDGYCRGAEAGPLKCVPSPGGCANEYERCSSAADCCDHTDQCINGHCAQPGPK